MDSFALFSPPSLLTGMARTIDLFGRFDAYNYSRSGEAADALAFRLDRAALAADCCAAIEMFEREVDAGDHARQLVLDGVRDP